jgi:hypothetical protein
MESDAIKTETQFVALPHQLLELFMADMRSEKTKKNKINTTDFLIYTIYLRHTNQKHHYAWISNARISKDTGLRVRTIGISIEKLMRLGYIYRFKPTAADRKANSGLYNSYCTRPLIRMTKSTDPIIDERGFYKDRILAEIRKKQNAANHRELKKSEKTIAKKKSENTDRREILEPIKHEIYLGDDVPF